MRHRNSGGRGSRAMIGTSSGPTPISSTLTTPMSSAPISAYTSEAELEQLDSLSAITNSIADLTMDVPIANAKEKKHIKPFRFFDLPTELRLKIYGYYFANVGDVLDLDHDNWKRVHKPLGILRTCRAVYNEASHHFYSTHIIRLFPIYGKFFRAKKPLLARMKSGPRASLTTLELRLGPGWNRPPRGWVVNNALGLKDCINVSRLKVFVECDPSNDVFKGFRASDGFYEKFSRDLLDAVLVEMPWCEIVEFDANPSVKKSGAMMSGLLETTTAKGRRLAWGPEKGWDDEEEPEEEIKPINHGPIGSGKTLSSQSHYFPEGGHQMNGHGQVPILA